MSELRNHLAKLAIGSPALEAVQLTKLKQLLTGLYDNNPYYRDKFSAAGVNPHEMTSLKDLEAYPMFTKEEERVSQARSLEEDGNPLGKHLSCDIRQVNRISASSGTTGTPSFQGHTKNDRDIIQENFGRLAEVTGLKPGDRVMMMGVMSMWVAGIPTVDALLNFGANVIPIGGLVGAAKVAEMIQLTRPQVLVGTPSSMRHVLQKARNELNIDLTQCGIEQLCVYGEPGGSVREIVEELSNGFGGASVYDMAGGTGCLNPIFVSCKAHDGMHFIAPDYAYIELYDRATETVLPMVDGAEGEFVYTGLDRECGPLVRFMDGDLIRVNLKPCGCGLPGMRISILGRVDDMLLIKGVNVFPSAIRDAVLGFGDQVTGSVRVVKTAEGPVQEPPLAVKVETKGTLDDLAKGALKEEIESEIARRLRFKANVQLFDEGALPVIYGATGKAKILE